MFSRNIFYFVISRHEECSGCNLFSRFVAHLKSETTRKRFHDCDRNLLSSLNCLLNFSDIEIKVFFSRSSIRSSRQHATLSNSLLREFIKQHYLSVIYRISIVIKTSEVARFNCAFLSPFRKWEKIYNSFFELPRRALLTYSYIGSGNSSLVLVICFFSISLLYSIHHAAIGGKRNFVRSQ